MLERVSPSFPSVTCNGRRIGTDGLSDRHVTLYSRIPTLIESVSLESNNFFESHFGFVDSGCPEN